MIESLQLKIASEKSIIAAQAKILPLKYFATSFTAAQDRKGAAIRVPVFDVGDAAEFDVNNNNYGTATAQQSGDPPAENPDYEVKGVDITLNKHFVKSIQFTDRDFAECDVNFFADAGFSIGRVLGKACVGQALGLINATNVSQTSVFTATEGASKTAIANLYAVADANKIDPAEANVIVTPQIYAAILAQLDADVFGGDEAIRRGVIPGLYGFNSFACSSQFADGVNGAILHKEAIGMAGRVLYADEEAYSEVGVATDEKTGLSIGFRRFADPKTGLRYIAGEMLFGVDLLQPKAVVRLTAE